MKLYVHPLSTPALTAELGANALGIAFEKKTVNLATGEQSSPEYLAVNPRGKVPALEDDGFLLAESAAILRYMARKEKSPQYPSGLQERALVEQWMDFAIQHVRAPMSRIQFNRLVAPMIGQPSDESSIQTGLHLLGANLPAAEEKLAASPFLCGEDMTLADIMLLGALDPAEALKVDLSPYPHISKWRDNLRKQAFYTDVHSHFGQELGL